MVYYKTEEEIDLVRNSSLLVAKTHAEIASLIIPGVTTLELDKIVFSIAAKKFLTSYLIKEGVKEDNVNAELNKSVDELYGKPYDEKKTGECTKYIYKLIPESKIEIDKLVKSGIY